MIWLFLLLQDAPDFRHDVQPILTRLGCNAGSCHGAAKGQNNFRLSLLGYDAEFDHESIALELRSRRIHRADPAQSLLLLKPTQKVKHGGGRPLKEDSDDYRTLLDWIKAGAPLKTRDVELVSVAASPESEIVPSGETRQIRVVAKYSDGTTRDVTRHALFSTNDDSIVTVNAHGIAKIVGKGETAVIVRYGGHVLAVRLGSPIGEFRGFESANLIDDVLARKWASLGIQPAPRADEHNLKRRMSLDLTGTLPDGSDPMDRPEFVSYWTYRLCEIFLVRDKALAGWIRTQVERDAPLNEIARQLITAKGREPMAAFYGVTQDPREMMEFSLQVFHGFRVQCANCHNHPLERFSQDEYHRLAATFARVRYDRGITISPRGELTHPGTGKNVVPQFEGEDRRGPFAEWLVTDRRFALAWANRIWGEVFGRGLVHPVDDMRASNPAAVPELLEALADEFSKTYRLRPFIKLLISSNAYALSSKGDDRFFGAAVVKPLRAEVLVDAMAHATGIPNPYGRAVDQLDLRELEVFGRCPRTLSCTLKPEFGGSLRKALHLVAQDLDGAKIPQSVDELYRRVLSRPATRQEALHWKNADLKDLLWALLVSNEFQFRH